MESYVELNPVTIVRYNSDLRVNIVQPLERKMDGLILKIDRLEHRVDGLILEIARLEDRVKSLEKKITNNKTLNIDLKK